MVQRIYKHVCKECETAFYVESLKLISACFCPSCSGKSIHVGEDKVEQDNQKIDALMYASEAISSMQEKNKRLLVIELQDEDSVPKVFYKGEEVRLKQHVFFDWDTDTSIPGGLTYAIEHIVTDERYGVTNRIERRVKGHATT